MTLGGANNNLKCHTYEETEENHTTEISDEEMLAACTLCNSCDIYSTFNDAFCVVDDHTTAT